MKENFLARLPLSFQEDIGQAITLLLSEVCTEIYLFGSLVNGGYTEESDIDIAVKGLQKGRFYEVGGKLMLRLKHNFDLIKLDDENSRFVQILKNNQVILRVS